MWVGHSCPTTTADTTMKKSLALACGIILLVGSIVFVRRHIHDNAAQAQRDATYHGILSSYQRELHAGMTRVEVQLYLDSRRISYLNDRNDYDVLIGEDPGDGLACDRWNVYVAFDFNISPRESKASASDTLREIKLRKIGHCV